VRLVVVRAIGGRGRPIVRTVSLQRAGLQPLPASCVCNEPIKRGCHGNGSHNDPRRGLSTGCLYLVFVGDSRAHSPRKSKRGQRSQEIGYSPHVAIACRRVEFYPRAGAHHEKRAPAQHCRYAHRRRQPSHLVSIAPATDESGLFTLGSRKDRP
jgi:hypothetical protein